MLDPHRSVCSVLAKANPVNVSQMGILTLSYFDGFEHDAVDKIMTIAALYHIMCRIKGISPSELYSTVGNYIDRFWEAEDEDKLPILRALKSYMENEWKPVNPNTKLRLP